MVIELARAGLWGSTENATPLTAEDLKEVAETFPEIGKAPVTLGHQLADFMPAFGWVKKVWFDEKTGTLYGEVELNEILEQAYSEGLYRSWSVGIKRRATDGKRYLHHLAFLGAVPPKIKDLKVVDGSIVFAEEADEVWTELAERVRFVSRAKTDWPIADPDTPWDADGAKKRLFERGVLDKCCAVIELREGEDKPDALSRYHFPYCDVVDGRVKIVPKAVSAGIAYLHGARGVKVRPELARKARPVLEKLRKRIEEAKKRKEVNMSELETMKKKLEEQEKLLAEYQERFRKAKLSELIDAAKGKVPEGVRDKLIAFAETVPLDGEIEFSEADGSKVKKSPMDLLIEIFKAIPLPVEPERKVFAEFAKDDGGGISQENLMDKV